MDNAPLSFAQLRLWFAGRLAPDRPPPVVPFAQRLRGALDVPALRLALTAVVDRHTILRSRFTGGEAPRQIVTEAAGVPMPLRQIDEEDVGERVAELCTLPFDLAADPPLRAELMRIAPDDHVLLVVVHHIAFDGWSLGVFGDELATWYDALTTGAPSPR